jgi:RHS repeat-associated protein
MAAGTNTVTINAVDASGNATEAVYEVDHAGTGKTFTYDANGNLTADGTRAFEWSGRDQLVAVTAGAHRTEFSYDGLSRRIQEREKENGAVTSDTMILWAGDRVLEERAADGVVSRRLFSSGEQVENAAVFVTRDHLNTIRDTHGPSQSLTQHYDFDPWGRRLASGTAEIIRTGFTGHRWLSFSSLWLARHRLLDPDLGRWISEDPSVDQAALLNAHAYVDNNPVNYLDPDGLYKVKPGLPSPSPEIDLFLRCVEMLLGQTLFATSTSEVIPKHGEADPHRHGMAVDVRPTGDFAEYNCAAKACGAVYSQDERNHYHSQLTKKGTFKK